MASPAVERMKEALFTGLDYMAMPGDYLRGALADPGAILPGGRPVRRTTGRELLESYGLVSPNQEGFDVGDAAGFATDLLVDPLNVLLGAGAIKGGLKGVRSLAGAAKTGKAAESLTAAKSALGAIPGAVARQGKGMAYAIGAPVGGAYLMANNEEGSDWKDILGMGMMASPLVLPLAMAAGRKAKGVLPQLTRTRSVRDEAGALTKKTELVSDILSSDELHDSISVWGTAGGTAKARKHTQDVLVARGDVPATPEERTAAATRVMQAFPAHHAWSRRAAKLQEASAVLQPSEHGVLPISRPEIDFLEQLGIRDATKWQEIKRLLGGADARTPEAQAVVQQFLPR